MHRRTSGLVAASALLLAVPGLSRADTLPHFSIPKATGPIKVDGDVSDPAWANAARVDTWYETNPGDNTPPKVASVGWLTYDDKFFYAAFELTDPNPGSIRAPFSDRDNVSSDTDYAGVILDTRNDGRTGTLFLANPRGIQYDSVSDDVTGIEDSSPDFFWQSAARITPTGWTLEIRIPFSSLRYAHADPQTWGILLYRNYPRDFRYQIFNARLPRGGQCFICNSAKLDGLTGLPSGSHVVATPYVSGSYDATPGGDVVGAPLDGSADGHVGLDVKWTPGVSTAVDVTVNPDFSQIESDVALIGANERFALLYPEKRPFFLEGVELFSTPVQAVYTRTITSPSFGARATGKIGTLAYTGLVAEDRGGGSVVIPGSDSSDTADQEFHSFVAIGRVRQDLGRSFVSVLATDREVQDGGFNRVAGPDFQWRISPKDTITGQFLYSFSETPNRPELAEEWDGRHLEGHAAYAWWQHTTTHVDLYTEYKDYDRDFRADDGFVPQVGIREADGEYGYTFRPQGFFRRFRTFVNVDHTTDADGVVQRWFSFGTGWNAGFNSDARLRLSFEDVRAAGRLLPRTVLYYNVGASPSRVLSSIRLQGSVGDGLDFDNGRTGRGLDAQLQVVVRPTNHLELRSDEARRFLNVDLPQDQRSRLFTAKVDRLRATYTFTSRVFARVIAQYVTTERDPALYTSSVTRRAENLTFSALFAYKLNWQTVLFVGYGDARDLVDDLTHLAPSDRQLFAKIAYAFQH